MDWGLIPISGFSICRYVYHCVTICSSFVYFFGKICYRFRALRNVPSSCQILKRNLLPFMPNLGFFCYLKHYFFGGGANFNESYHLLSSLFKLESEIYFSFFLPQVGSLLCEKSKCLSFGFYVGIW